MLITTVKEEESILANIQQILDQATEYYKINKSQAKSSFTISIAAMVLGFLIIAVGILIFYFKANPNVQIITIILISGIITEFISGAYFWLYNKNIQQLNYFFDKLVKLQDTMLAVTMINRVDEKSQPDILRQVISILITRNEPHRELSPELIKAIYDNKRNKQ